MLYGVDSKQQHAKPLPAAAPPAIDPWLTSADPWWSPSGASPVAQPEAAWPGVDAAWQASDAAWPPLRVELNAFGKGKGKDKGKGYGEPRPPMECYNCCGKGHPLRVGPTLLGAAG